MCCITKKQVFEKMPPKGLGGFNSNSIFSGNHGGPRPGGGGSWRHPNFDHGNWNRWGPGWNNGWNNGSWCGFGGCGVPAYSYPYYAYAYAPTYAAYAYTVPVVYPTIPTYDTLVYTSSGPFVV